VQNEVIQSANLFFLIAGGYGIYKLIRWRHSGYVSPETQGVIGAWCFMVLGATLSAGWFWASRLTAPAEFTHNPDMREWRWLAVSIANGLFVWGLLKFIREIEGFSPTRKIMLFIVLAAISAAAVFL